MPTIGERIDFQRVAAQIVAMVTAPPREAAPRDSGVRPTPEEIRVAKNNATRKIGLVYVIEQSDPAGKLLANPIAFSQLQRDLIARAVAAQPFGQVLARGGTRLGKQLFEIRPFAADLMPRPNLYARVARFSVLQIRGFSFADLRSALPSGQCVWDFGYQLEDLLNGVLSGVPDALSIAGVKPDEPSFSLTCHGPPTGPLCNNPYDWPVKAMNLPEAWTISTMGADGYGDNIRVGHLDTGYSDHPALFDQAKNGGRLLWQQGDDPEDENQDATDPLVTTIFNSEPGHGTSTATLIMSASDGDPETLVNPEGVIGAAPRAEIVPIRVCESTAFIFNSKVAEGLASAIARNCNVVSMSVGGFDVPGFEQVADIARQQNILLVAAAGNCTYDVAAPASYSQVLAVGASCKDSSYWQHAPDDAKVAIAAPGDNVRTTEIIEGVAGNIYTYNFGSGTSFSTAFAAGVAALWLAFVGKATLAGVPAGNLGAIFNNAVQSSANTPAGWDTSVHGAGIIDAGALLSLDIDAVLNQPLPPPPPVTANGTIDSAQSYLTRLSNSVYRDPGHESDMLAAAHSWFSVPDNASALGKIDKFGGEMVNLLLQTKSDVGKPAFQPIGKTPQQFLQFFQRNGSAALRAALTP
jgi:hypothetical protein